MLQVVQLLKNFPATYGTEPFISLPTRTAYQSLILNQNNPSSGMLCHVAHVGTIININHIMFEILPRGIFVSVFISELYDEVCQYKYAQMPTVIFISMLTNGSCYGIIRHKCM
jgi:hypothetical protein